MKYIMFTLLFLFSGLVFSQANNTCNNLDCVDEEFKNKYFVKYYDILNKALNAAKGCKDTSQLDEVLEFTSKIVKKGARERMAQFIEKEFILNPTCFFSAFKRISTEARTKSEYYLANPRLINKSKIYIILEDYSSQYPALVQSILNHKL